jgi:hypothetical protein
MVTFAWLRWLSPLLCRSSVWPGPGMVSNYEPLTGLLGRRLGGILLGGTSMLLVVASTAAYPLLLLLLLAILQCGEMRTRSKAKAAALTLI